MDERPEGTQLCDLGFADYDEIMDLWLRSGLKVRPEGRDSPQAFKRQMLGGCQRVIGLRLDDRLAGVAVLTHDGRKGWVNRLAVDPACRRRGFAGYLIGQAEEWFVDQLGLEVCSALIEPGNTASLELFAANDYTRTDIVYLAKRVRPGS